MRVSTIYLCLCALNKLLELHTHTHTHTHTLIYFGTHGGANDIVKIYDLVIFYES